MSEAAQGGEQGVAGATSRDWGRIVWSLTAALAALLMAGAVIAIAKYSSSDSNFKDAAAAIAISGAIAVGIERLLEGMWTAVGFLKGTWWPMNKVAKTIDSWVIELSTTITPFYQQATSVLNAGVTAGKWTKENADIAIGHLEQVQKKAKELANLAPGSDRAQLLSAAVARSVAYVQNAYEDPQLQSAANAALEAVNSVADLAKSFKDNPGRRLISIYLGSLLGLGLAATLGLDLFHAIAEVGDIKVLGVTWHAGVVFTGLALGLGSNPTHELIKSLQEYKNSKKGTGTNSPAA